MNEGTTHEVCSPQQKEWHLKKCRVNLKNVKYKVGKQITEKKKVIWEVNRNLSKKSAQSFQNNNWEDPSSDESEEDENANNLFNQKLLLAEDSKLLGKNLVPFDQLDKLYDIDNTSDSDLSIRIDRMEEAVEGFNSKSGSRHSSPRRISLKTSKFQYSPVKEEEEGEEEREMTDDEEYDFEYVLETEMIEDDINEVALPDLEVPEDGEVEIVTEKLLKELRKQVEDVDWMENDEGEWVVKGDNKKDIHLKQDGGYVVAKLEPLFKAKKMNVKMRNIRKIFGLLDKPMNHPILVENRDEETHPLPCPFNCPIYGVPCEARFKISHSKDWYEHVREGWCPYDPRYYPKEDVEEVICTKCPWIIDKSKITEHLAERHFAHKCPGCSEKFEAKMDVEDHIINEHASHFLASGHVKQAWRREEMKSVMKPPEALVKPLRLPSPSPSPSPEPRDSTPSPEPDYTPPKKKKKKVDKKPEKMIEKKSDSVYKLNYGVLAPEDTPITEPYGLPLPKATYARPQIVRAPMYRMGGPGHKQYMMVGRNMIPAGPRLQARPPQPVIGGRPEPKPLLSAGRQMPVNTGGPSTGTLMYRPIILQASGQNQGHQVRMQVQQETGVTPRLSLLPLQSQAQAPKVPTNGLIIGQTEIMAGARPKPHVSQHNPPPSTSAPALTPALHPQAQSDSVVKITLPNSGRLVWARPVSSQSISGSNKVCTKYVILGSADNNAPPPPTVLARPPPEVAKAAPPPYPVAKPPAPPAAPISSVIQRAPPPPAQQGGRPLAQVRPSPVPVPAAPNWRCNACPRAFTSKTGLAHHLRQSHGQAQGPFMCTQCPKPVAFSTNNQYQIHMDLVHKSKPKPQGVACPYCVKNGDKTLFLSQAQLNAHLRLVHNGEGALPSAAESNFISCNDCGTGFHTYQALTHHKKNGCPGSSKQIPCPQPNCYWGGYFLNDLNRHCRTDHASMTHFTVTCFSCARPFTSVALLKKHCDLAHEGVLVGFPNKECTECGASFYTSEELEDHIQTIHRLQCAFCDGQFTSQADLDSHTRDSHRLDSDGAPIAELKDEIGVDPLEDPLGGVDPLGDINSNNEGLLLV